MLNSSIIKFMTQSISTTKAQGPVVWDPSFGSGVESLSCVFHTPLPAAHLLLQGHTNKLRDLVTTSLEELPQMTAGGWNANRTALARRLTGLGDIQEGNKLKCGLCPDFSLRVSLLISSYSGSSFLTCLVVGRNQRILCRCRVMRTVKLHDADAEFMWCRCCHMMISTSASLSDTFLTAREREWRRPGVYCIVKNESVDSYFLGLDLLPGLVLCYDVISRYCIVHYV